jgi:cytochrome c5
LTACTSGKTSSTGSSSVTADGKTLMQKRCSVCHSLDRVITAHKTSAEWTTTVNRMISHGAQLNTQEKQTLIDYLAATYK